jgi:hypothetical protein
MVAGDNIRIDVYSSADGSNERLLDTFNISNAPTLKMTIIGPYPTADYIKFVIQRTAGTDRAYAWRVLNMNGV